jgi:hypothetical protein
MCRYVRHPGVSSSIREVDAPCAAALSTRCFRSAARSAILCSLSVPMDMRPRRGSGYLKSGAGEDDWYWDAHHVATD